MAPVKKQNHFVFLTVAADGLAVVAGFLLTYLLRFVWGVIPKSHVPPLDVYAQALLVVVPVYIAMFRAYGLYQAHRHVRRIEEIFLVVKAVTFSIVILMAVTFFYRELTYSRVYLLLMWAVSVLTVSLARYFLIQWEYLRKRRKNEITRVLMIGGNRNARQIVRWARNNAHYGQEVIGVLVREPELVGKHFEGAPIVGVCAQWESFISHLKPEKVVLVDPAFTRVEITELVALCEEQWIEFKLAADFFGLMTRNVDVDYISTVPLLGFRALPLDDFWCRSLKRAFDLVVTSAIFLATFPVWLAVMAAIKLDDGGPLFYRQERIGRDLEGFE
ncbi:MAG: sugar transferase, partial [Candidatus Omnitrophota bacterium]